MSLKVILLACAFVISFSFLEAHALPEQYGIAYSKPCIIMLQNNMTTFCPKSEYVLALFPDTTNQNIVGKLVEKDGIIQRGKPNVIFAERYYDRSGGTVMWWDPPNEVRKKIKMIYLEPSLPPYKTGDESLKMNDYNVSFKHMRYVTPNCGEAKISSQDWFFLLGDTMNYLKHNCDPAFTSFDETVTLQFVKSYQNLEHSNKYKLDQMVKIAKEKYKSYHIGNDIFKNPAVTTDEDE